MDLFNRYKVERINYDTTYDAELVVKNKERKRRLLRIQVEPIIEGKKFIRDKEFCLLEKIGKIVKDAVCPNFLYLHTTYTLQLKKVKANVNFQFLELVNARVEGNLRIAEFEAPDENIVLTRDNAKAFTFGLLAAYHTLHFNNINHMSINTGNIIGVRKRTRPDEVGLKGSYYYVYGLTGFAVPKRDQSIVPIIKDFKNSNQDIDEYFEPNLEYIAPELIFITGERPMYDEKTEVFLLGLFIFNSISTRNIFDKVENKDQYEKGAEEYLKHCTESNYNRVKDIFLCENQELVFKHAWILTHILGWLTNKDVPGVENTKIWQILNKYKSGDAKQRKFGGPFMRGVLGDGLYNLLRSMLKWNRDERPTFLELLKTAEYFNNYRANTITDIQRQKKKYTSDFGYIGMADGSFRAASGKDI